MAKKQKKQTYLQLVQTAHANCGGKSQPKFGDIKEFAGHLATLLAQDEDYAKTFLALGKRRLNKLQVGTPTAV